MNNDLQKLIKQAEEDTWVKINRYRTLMEAVAHTKNEVFAHCLAQRIINYCIESCDSDTDSELIKKLNLLIKSET